MKSIRGLQYEVGLQTVQHQQTTFSAASAAGQKRSRSEVEPTGLGLPANHENVRFQRAFSVPDAPARLAASRIVDLDGGRGISEYSQRRMFSATPTSTMDPELNLAHPVYGLPSELVHNFASMGIKQIYPWQKSCLKGPGLLSGTKNLVYCAPTGGGKSLVSDCKL